MTSDRPAGRTAGADLLLRSALALAALAAAVAAPAAPRIVAIGDVHGALEQLDAILREAALVDEEGAWAGGDAVLVQTGDFTDRGARVRGVMDRLRALQEQAPAAGGAVHVLLGNHEAMNLLLLFRDVNPETYAEFVGPGSEEKRREALERSRSRAGDEGDDAFDESAWLAAHPPGRIEYAESFGPDGEYGRWLRSLPASVRVGDTVFVHGGYSDEVELGSPGELNRALAAQLDRFDDARRTLIRARVLQPFDDLIRIESAVAREVARFTQAIETGRSFRSPIRRERHRLALLAIAETGLTWALRTDSPLWFRGYATWSLAEGTPRIAALLERFGAERFVVGHTVIRPPGAIHGRFGGRVFLIDTGMLRQVYGGRPSALEIRGGLIRAIYVGADDEVLWGEVPPLGEALAILRDGDVVAQSELPRGVTRPLLVELESGDRRVRAIFRHGTDERSGVRLRDDREIASLRDHWRNEVAAFRLARALGLTHVPATVERRIGSRDGSLQLWIEAGEATPAGEGQGALADMAVFDNLIQNLDRHAGNVVRGPDGRVWWIDHTRSLSSDPRLPSPERIRVVSPGLWDRLRGATDGELRAAAGESLGRFELDALLERRRRLVEHVEGLIRERGEEVVIRDADSHLPAAVPEPAGHEESAGRSDGA